MKIPKELNLIKVGTLIVPTSEQAIAMIHYGHVIEIDHESFTIEWQLTNRNQLYDPDQSHILKYEFKSEDSPNWKKALANNRFIFDEKEALAWKIKND
jgi:hypothetical protein